MKLPALDLLPNRPVLVALGGLGLLLALAVGPVSRAIDAQAEIAAARDRLARAQAASTRPPQPAPLTAPDADALLAAFRARLDGLAANRAVVIDAANYEPDPAQPTLPRLRAYLRGTAEGLHGLLHALETEAPLMAVEAADLDVARAADEDGGRPLVMRASLTVRGVQLPPPPPETGGRAP
ncbi:GspMb/PilO family protein [Methylorubrum sp. SB2]|uniref:GspMb/PilO family protein n=1 Tax=Methylorubrum subtropicum TaxID=3138812 RepID=UPI00313C06B8